MTLMFVFMLASGSIFYQPQSELNCAKLAAALASGEKVTASIEGEDVPILRGMCIRVEKASTLKLLRTIAGEWAETS